MLAPSGARPARRRDRRLPGPAQRDGLRAAPRGPRRARRRGSSRPRWPSTASTSRSGARRRARARSPARPASCASPPAATCATSAAGAGRSTARSRCSTRASRTASCAADAYPDALAPRVVGADVPDVRRRAALGRARLRVRRLGRRRPRRRRQPRLAAPRRLARRPGLLRRRRAARPRRRGRSPTSRRWSARTSAPDGCGDRTPWSTRRRGRAVAPWGMSSPRSLILTLGLAAAALAPAASAQAATVLSSEPVPTHVAAWNGTVMWSQLDQATGNYRLVKSVNGGAPKPVDGPRAHRRPVRHRPRHQPLGRHLRRLHA